MSRVIRDNYTFQEKNLFVHDILGELYGKKIVGRPLKERINVQQCSQDKARILLDHLERTDTSTLLQYCTILERSAEENGLACHKAVAQRIRSAFHGNYDTCLQKVVQYLEYQLQEDGLCDCICPEDQVGAQIVPYRSPQRLKRAGVLNSPLFKMAFDMLWGMSEREPIRARLAVESIQKHKDYPLDMRAALTQAGAGFSFESISLLHKALDLCSHEDCLNASLIACRIHWQLMWCHDKLGNTERRDHHRVQALSHAHSIDPDFSAAFIFAWSGHVMLCSNTGPISRDTEKDARDLLCNAIQYIQQCSEMQWFAQALKLYKADLHLTLAKSYQLRNNFEAAAIHEDDANECTRLFHGVPQGENISRIEAITREVLNESELGTVSEFGQYTFTLYLKLGQWQRARKVLSVVGDHRLLPCIDAVQERARGSGLLVC